MGIRVARWLAMAFLGVPILVTTPASGEGPPHLSHSPVDNENQTVSIPAAPSAGRAPQLLESFDDPTFPPPGWSEQYFSGSSPWDRATIGSEPTIDTHSGAGMSRWSSATYPAGDSTLLSSPPLDFSGSTQPTLTFWMSHDAGAPGSDDRVRVWASTDGGASWTSQGAAISRHDANCLDACWVRHDTDLTSYAGQINFYVGLQATSEAGHNIFIDDLSVGEPAPDLSSSTTNAPPEVLEGDPIDLTIEIINSGSAAAAAATLVNVLPTGTTYIASSLVCSSGTTCAYNGGANQIEWAGSVAAPGSVTVSFSIDPSGLPCGAEVVNQAVVDDPELIGGPVETGALTRIVSAYLVLDEGFDLTVFPPPGWGENVLVGSSSWDRVTAGANPLIDTRSGPGMARWNAYSVPAGDSTRLVTPAVDLSALTQPNLTFWMSHDDDFPSSDDRVTVQLSTDGGATWADTGGPISRHDSECVTPCWQLHRRDLSSYAGLSNIRVGLAAVSEGGNDLFVDDLQIADPWHPCPHVSLVDDAIGGTCQGETNVHGLTVTNGSLITDTLEISETSVWPIGVDPSSFLLAPGESATTSVSVRIPWSAGRGDQHEAELVLEGLGSGLTDAARVTTYALVAADHSDHAQLPPTPAGLWTSDHSLVFLDGALIKIGGFSGLTQDLTAVFDIASGIWTTTDLLPAPRQKLDCVAIGGKIYCAGGFDTTPQDSLFIFDPAAPPGSRWTAGTPMPDARYGYAGVALDGRYYVIGGVTSTVENTMLVYDPVNDTWAGGPAVPTMAVARFAHSAGAMNGRIFVVGGLTGPSSGTNVTEIYDPVTDSWSVGAPLPRPSWMHAADGVIDDRFLLLVGGYLSDATASFWVLAYDAMHDIWMVPQTVAPHKIYASEGASDADGNFWYVSGRLFENWSFSYSPYTTKVSGCPGCPEVTGADFSWDPPAAVTLFPTTFTGSAAGLAPIDYAWNFDGLGSDTGQVVDFTFPDAGTYSVTMTATNCDGTAQDIAIHDVEVVPAPMDLAIDKGNGTSFVVLGSETHYQITVSNNGALTANGALVEDLFPADLINVTWTCSGTGGASCTTSGTGDISELVDLPPASQVTFEVTATVSPSAGGMLSNTAGVAVPAGAADPNPFDNTSTDTDEVVIPIFADGFESGTTGAWS